VSVDAWGESTPEHMIKSEEAVSDEHSDPSPGLSDPTPGLTLVGMTPCPGQIQNTGRGRIVLIGQDGSRIVIEPGQVGVIPKGPHWFACPDCGMHTGQHEAGCEYLARLEAALIEQLKRQR